MGRVVTVSVDNVMDRDVGVYIYNIIFSVVGVYIYETMDYFGVCILNIIGRLLRLYMQYHKQRDSSLYIQYHVQRGMCIYIYI